ncbi:hypothetical protein PsYK624_052770 [Phanerochaete sordida]|uniref:PCI domain-containing protein n=1 Tax=Phanerochaete sordida TaxID=48140 RepID=A0A9P3G4U0_9APHY|nr:hypothetical protein PsYK624_052770 [Phanerochaete sordida]
MDLGANFTAKLEPFLLMSKSAKGAGAAKLIQDATSAPGVFVFAELLDQPNIQELANNEQHAAFFSLLQLFSYKTYSDYLQYKDSLPALNDAQTTKLKHLTLVSLAHDRRILPYDHLLSVLQVSSIRELEDLIIDAIYQDVIRGKLDQKEQQFEVEYIMGRDLEPGKVESLLAALQHWASTTSAVLATLDDKLAKLSKQAVQEKAAKETYDKAYQGVLGEITEKQKEVKLVNRPVNTLKSGPTAAGIALMERRKEQERLAAEEREREKKAADEMDVDDENGKGKTRSSSQGDASKSRKRNRT